MAKRALALLLLAVGIVSIGYYWRASYSPVEVISSNEPSEKLALNHEFAAGQSAGMIPKKTEDQTHFSTPEEFHVFAKSTLQKLPHLADFKKLKAEDVHETPFLIRQAGVDLGSIAAAVSEDIRLAPEAFHFYEECAANADLPDSIRALCYSHYLHWGTELKESLNSNIVPDEIKALAKRL